jgi:Concanavalin A-like lectin/glucanases superfamily
MFPALLPKRWTLKPGPGVRMNRLHPLANGLQVCWLLNEGAGVTVQDSAGLLTGSLVNSPAWSTGKVGPALSFNGSNTNVTGANAPTATTFSVACWMMTTTLVQSGVLMERSPVNGKWILFISYPNLYWRLINGTGDATVALSGLITSGVWAHVAGTFDGTNSRLYVNGVLQASATPTAAAQLATDTLYLGCYDNSGYFFTGKIESAFVWNRALAAHEVLSHFLNSYEMFAPARPWDLLNVAAAPAGAHFRRGFGPRTGSRTAQGAN